MENVINVIVDEEGCVLEYPEADVYTTAYIGKNGVTDDPKEGAMMTPLGTFDLGLVMGMHDPEEVKCELPYIKIEDNMYLVDDVNSKYYNQLFIEGTEEKDFESAEHLSDYKVQYEYLIEIKSNPNNIKGKGSAIFLHCKNKDYTYGCVSIDREDMQKIISTINKDTKIKISKKELKKKFR